MWRPITEAELAYIRENVATKSSREMRIALGLEHSWQLRYRAKLAGVQLSRKIRRNVHLQRKFTQQEKDWLAANYKHVSVAFIERFLRVSRRALYRNLHEMGYSKRRQSTYQPINNQ
nr:MAG TPA: Homeodomain-like domain [Bacteriophage sp.]